MSDPSHRVLAIVTTALALATIPPLTCVHAQELPSVESHTSAPTVAPPAPQREARTRRPFADAVWTSGFWTWNGRSYVWQHGAWSRPEPGHRWSPYRWEQRHGHWFLVPGGWVPTHEGVI